ncbi:MAG: T9SS type A sorting domain-containing protein [Tannerella sp.]|jgi:hypothetical protein|nr:T9SS type A sorting domain-containing protein [Tannerella sp.]
MKIVINIFLFCLATSSILGQEACWYYLGQKKCFEMSVTKLLVKSEKLDNDGIKIAIENMHVGDLKEILEIDDFFYIEMLQTSKVDVLELQRKLSAIEDVVYASRVLWDERGVEGTSYSNEVRVRLKSKEDYFVLQKIAEEYQIKSISINDLDELKYNLILPHNPQKDAMDVALELHETGLFEYASPNLIFLWPLDIPNSVPYIKHEKNRIYPNPARDMLSIEISRAQINSIASYVILLFNSQGNLLRREQAKENIVHFDISALPNGIYFLHISDGTSATSETHKIIVKH